ncbi:MAG TPA: tail fiber protein [Saprospiraceae bacterium]|nr:tail fiber protein [Saprospiraceae bacterium]
MYEPFIGAICMFGFNFAPKGWATCDGQLLQINQNTALFSLLGTTFGGNGMQTFGFPDLRGRVPIHQKQGPGLSAYSMGEAAGTETVTLTVSQMPMHNHMVNANSAPGDTGAPAGAIFANSGATDREYIASGQPNVLMSQNIVAQNGGSQSHNNMQPFLTVNFCIALVGIFPPRN